MRSFFSKLNSTILYSRKLKLQRIPNWMFRNPSSLTWKYFHSLNLKTTVTKNPYITFPNHHSIINDWSFQNMYTIKIKKKIPKKFGTLLISKENLKGQCELNTNNKFFLKPRCAVNFLKDVESQKTIRQ